MDPRQQLLSQLHDIVTPNAPGYWPLAPLWWLLVIVTISSIAAGVYFYFKYRTMNAYKKYATHAFSELCTTSATPQEKAHKIIALLKRTYFSAYPNERQQHAGLHSVAWLECLNSKQTPKLELTELTQNLDDFLYASPNSDQVQQKTLSELEKFAKHWLRHHKHSRSKIDARLNAGETKHVHV